MFRTFVFKKNAYHFSNYTEQNTHKRLNTMKMDIQINKGIGEIFFSSTIENILDILGKPDTIEDIENAADKPTTVLTYEDSMTLFFEGESKKLTCIDIIDEDTTLFGKTIFELDEAQLIALMKDNNFKNFEKEKEDWGETRITYKPGDIDFYFEDDELISVNIGD